MVRVGQIGIALGALGIVLTFMGLFPAVTGLPPTPGIGVVQLAAILIGFSLLIIGAYIYARFTFYAHIPSNLAQQIAVRLSLTGLLFAGMASMADVFGFGSNVRTETSDIFFGPWQAGGLIGGFVIASLGVLIYAVTGPIENGEPPEEHRVEKEKSAEPEQPPLLEKA
jgi:hypothetical protein